MSDDDHEGEVEVRIVLTPRLLMLVRPFARLEGVSDEEMVRIAFEGLSEELRGLPYDEVARILKGMIEEDERDMLRN